jgi:hypothetical protein
MPKAPVHKYDRTPGRKYKIRRARQVMAMKPVSVSHAMNESSDDNFWFGVD